MASLEKDIVEYIENEGFGTVGTDLFIGDFTIQTPNEATLLQQVGGDGQNLYVEFYTVDIAFVARSQTYEGAVTKLQAIQSLFDNRTRFSLGVNKKFILYFYTQSGRTDLGKNVNGNHEQSQNYMVRYREYVVGD